jgi:DNA-directed RNA polymerase specialized sigma subunit
MATKKPAVKRAKATSSSKFYVTNADLMEAIAADKKTGVLSEKLAKMLFMIAERYSFKSSFGGYSFREDMVSAAVVNLCANWHKFDPEKGSNAFSYFTTAVHRVFLQMLSDEKRGRDIRDQLLIDAGASPSFSYQDRAKTTSTSDETAFRTKKDD